MARRRLLVEHRLLPAIRQSRQGRRRLLVENHPCLKKLFHPSRGEIHRCRELRRRLLADCRRCRLLSNLRSREARRPWQGRRRYRLLLNHLSRAERHPLPTQFHRSRHRRARP